jgi:hypothetical protein
VRILRLPGDQIASIEFHSEYRAKCEGKDGKFGGKESRETI